MSTYKHKLFVRQAIEGVMMQKTTLPYQLVIGEDSSNDGTRAICEEMKQLYGEKIKLLPSDKNYGQNNNLIRTIQACTGKYVALCEGDDYWIDPYKLQKQVDFLDHNPDCVMCFHQVHAVNHLNQMLEVTKPSDRVSFYKGKDFLHISVPTLSLVFRNCLHSFPGEFLKVKSTDAFIVAMLSGYGNGANLGFVGGCYRRHDGGLYNRLSTYNKYKQAIHTRIMMKRSSFFNEEQKKEIRNELVKREILYVKIFLKRREIMNFIKMVLFYINPHQVN